MACRFYNEYLGRIKLNDVFVDFTKKDMHYLMKESYDAAWIEAIGKATMVTPGAYKILYR